MAIKKVVLEQLADYFAKKGKIMSPTEYKAANDTPIRFIVAKRPFGSWARMQQMIQVNFPAQWEKANKGAPAPKAAVADAMKKAAAKAKTAPKQAAK